MLWSPCGVCQQDRWLWTPGTQQQQQSKFQVEMLWCTSMRAVESWLLMRCQHEGLTVNGIIFSSTAAPYFSIPGLQQGQQAQLLGCCMLPPATAKLWSVAVWQNQMLFVLLWALCSYWFMKDKYKYLGKFCPLHSAVIININALINKSICICSCSFSVRVSVAETMQLWENVMRLTFWLI